MHYQDQSIARNGEDGGEPTTVSCIVRLEHCCLLSPHCDRAALQGGFDETYTCFDKRSLTLGYVYQSRAHAILRSLTSLYL